MTAVQKYSVPCNRPLSTLSECDDAKLVALVLEGNPCAFRQLFHRHHGRMRGVASSIVSGADLDDVCQRAWLRIYRKLSTLREPRLFGAWASRICVNTALGLVRKQGRRAEVDLDQLPPALLPALSSAQVSERRRWRNLLRHTRHWFEELEPRDRRLFRHYLIDGMTMEEIGEAVGMSPGGVKTRLFRARKHLRDRRSALTDA